MIEFLRSTRGGATTIMCVAASMMAIAATTLLIEHNNLFSQRDVLNNAAAAASIAATQRMTRAPAGMDDATLQTELEAVARNWIMGTSKNSPFSGVVDLESV